MTNTGDSAKLLDTSWEAVKRYLTQGLTVLQKAEDLKKAIFAGEYRKRKTYYFYIDRVASTIKEANKNERNSFKHPWLSDL